MKTFYDNNIEEIDSLNFIFFPHPEAYSINPLLVTPKDLQNAAHRVTDLIIVGMRYNMSSQQIGPEIAYAQNVVRVLEELRQIQCN